MKNKRLCVIIAKIYGNSLMKGVFQVRFKKSFCLLLVFVLSILMTTTAFAVNDIEREYEYYVENGSAVLTKYIGDSKKITVPTEIDGHKVTKLIGTFCENTEIKSVEIPEGVTTVGYRTFYGCTNLKKIGFPDSVCEIGYEAFAYSAIKDIVLGPLVNYISPFCFQGCEKLFSVEFKAETQIGSDNYVFIDKDAFAESGVFVFFGSKMPVFYNPVYDSYFLEVGSLGYYMNNIVLLKPVLKLILNRTPFNSLLAFLYTLLLLTIIITVIIVLSRFIMSIFGRNSVADYRMYSKWVAYETGSASLEKNLVHYTKIKFKSDVFYSVLKTVAWILAAVMFISVYALVAFSVDITGNSFLQSGLIFAVCLVVTIIGVVAILKIRSVINEHKKFSDKPHIRIRKIRGGGEKDA